MREEERMEEGKSFYRLWGENGVCGRDIRRMNCYESLSCTLGCHLQSVITYPFAFEVLDSSLTSGLNPELLFSPELFHCPSE